MKLTREKLKKVLHITDDDIFSVGLDDEGGSTYIRDAINTLIAEKIDKLFEDNPREIILDAAPNPCTLTLDNDDGN